MEEWLPIQKGAVLPWLLDHGKELAHDAADGPHVDGGPVVLLQENELGCSVPPGHDVAS